MADQLEVLIGLGDDELLETLGRELWNEVPHATPATSESLKLTAKQWLKVNIPKARGAVCGNPVVKAVRTNAPEVVLIGTIADIFTKTLGFPVPAVVAVLIARIGFDRLCSGWVPEVKSE